MRIFDIQTHIRPGVDDGAGSMAEALQMLDCCVAADIQAVAVTPHCNVMGYWDNFADAAYNRAFRELCRAAEGLPVKLYPGAEVRVNERLLPLLQQRKLPTLGKGKFLLTEFPAEFPARDFVPVLDGILKEGYTPLIAHPERYGAVKEDPALVGPWLDMGCHVQLTGGSISGYFGRRVQAAAEYLLKNDMVCCVASDAHNATHRSNYLSDAYDHLSLCYGKRYADILMWENPEKICSEGGSLCDF